MRADELLKECPPALSSLEVSEITQDSRQATAGTMFFAIEGSTRDGHEFAASVAASAVVINKTHAKAAELRAKIANKLIEVDDTRLALAEAACKLQGHPSEKLAICGVTGTNGKTTSTYLLEALLREGGMRPAVIGTVENRFEDRRIASTHTTPDAVGLQRLLKDFLNLGATAVAMEVSSHALDQHRTGGMQFEAALFTNLTQDHLDYHKTLECYYQSKARLFLEYPVKARAVHADDPYGERLVDECLQKGFQVVTFGRRGRNVNYEQLRLSSSGIEGDLSISHKGTTQKLHLESPLLGLFNAQNIAGVVAVGIGLGIPLPKISAAITNAKQVPGRMETVPNNKQVTVIVDYAHTPDALENVLKTARALCRGRLFCLFGCGGDRDPGKRPLMGSIAEKLSDVIYVTSDNPRTENPNAIVEAILTGLKNPAKANVVVDRRAAIAAMIKALKPGDMALIAGKGHEDYQIIGTEKLPFDDRAVALENL